VELSLFCWEVLYSVLDIWNNYCCLLSAGLDSDLIVLGVSLPPAICMFSLVLVVLVYSCLLSLTYSRAGLILAVFFATGMCTLENIPTPVRLGHVWEENVKEEGSLRGIWSHKSNITRRKQRKGKMCMRCKYWRVGKQGNINFRPIYRSCFVFERCCCRLPMACVVEVMYEFALQPTLVCMLVLCGFICSVMELLHMSVWLWSVWCRWSLLYICSIASLQLLACVLQLVNGWLRSLDGSSLPQAAVLVVDFV
jgi:hypothetical protein